MMRMLSEGGVPAFTDNRRVADKDNPGGYFELEKVKSLGEDSGWIEDAAGKATKIVSMLLPKLPNAHRYKIIFLRRDLEEILMSQKKMLERSGKVVSDQEQNDLRTYFSYHLKNTIEWLTDTSYIDVLFVNYKDVLQEPVRVARSIADFVGTEMNIEAMVSVVDSSLYRQRAVDAE